jgi:hypothetical protein
MNGKSKKNQCISKETLSAYFDGEISLDKQCLQHLESCSICQNQLNEYKNFAKAMNKMMQIDPPENLQIKILNRIHNKTEQPTVGAFHFISILTKAASVIFALGLISFFSYYIINKNNNIVAVNHNNNMDKIVFLNHTTPSTKKNTQNTTLPNTGNINLNKFSQVSTNYTNTTPIFTKNNTNTAKIQNRVSHFWLNNNPKQTINFIKNNISSNANIKHNFQNGTLHISMSINKKDLVNLVRKLHSNGYILISPNQPQPEVRTFNGSPNEPVLYNAVFSKK